MTLKWGGILIDSTRFRQTCNEFSKYMPIIPFLYAVLQKHTYCGVKG